LSEHTTDADPRVSTDDSRFTIARFRAMRCTPSARTTERTAGSPSGTAATARETPISSTETRSEASSTLAVTRMEPTTTAAMRTTATPSALPMRSISRWSGVRSASVVPSRRAILPISVAMPVAVTTARPRPRVIAVPSKIMFSRSPRAAGSSIRAGSLRTASLSPVSDASATRRDAALTRRASALTASPSAARRRSPGTTSAAGIRSSRPPRITPAVAAARRWSAATACSARASCTYPSTAFRRTIAAMTIASYGISSPPSRAQAASETTTAPMRR
jgi:hypothetical protein